MKFRGLLLLFEIEIIFKAEHGGLHRISDFKFRGSLLLHGMNAVRTTNILLSHVCYSIV